MEPRVLAGELRAQLRVRPYTTLIGVAGVGWLLGRSVPLRAWLALAGVGARAAVGGMLEDAVRQRFGGPR